jgi:hypothetical protein
MSIRNAFFVILFAAACGPLRAEAPGQEPPPATPPAGEAAENSEPISRPPVQRGSDEWCARSFCGCWEDVTLRYSARIVDADGAPVEGVDAVCHGETEPIATSSAGGVLAFEIATQTSPGCGYQRCRIMTLADPQGRFADKEIVAGVTNGRDVVVEGR